MWLKYLDLALVQETTFMTSNGYWIMLFIMLHTLGYARVLAVRREREREREREKGMHYSVLFMYSTCSDRLKRVVSSLDWLDHLHTSTLH